MSSGASENMKVEVFKSLLSIDFFGKPNVIFVHPTRHNVVNYNEYLEAAFDLLNPSQKSES